MIRFRRSGRLELRIGVNLGDVIGDGDDIFGDGVNIAARLEALAQPGTVCISQTPLRSPRQDLWHGRFTRVPAESFSGTLPRRSRSRSQVWPPRPVSPDVRR
jgi:class 3 adenylate cyclase